MIRVLIARLFLAFMVVTVLGANYGNGASINGRRVGSVILNPVPENGNGVNTRIIDKKPTTYRPENDNDVDAKIAGTVAALGIRPGRPFPKKPFNNNSKLQNLEVESDMNGLDSKKFLDIYPQFADPRCRGIIVPPPFPIQPFEIDPEIVPSVLPDWIPIIYRPLSDGAITTSDSDILPRPSSKKPNYNIGLDNLHEELDDVNRPDPNKPFNIDPELIDPRCRVVYFIPPDFSPLFLIKPSDIDSGIVGPVIYNWKPITYDDSGVDPGISGTVSVPEPHPGSKNPNYNIDSDNLDDKFGIKPFDPKKSFGIKPGFTGPVQPNRQPSFHIKHSGIDPRIAGPVIPDWGPIIRSENDGGVDPGISSTGTDPGNHFDPNSKKINDIDSGSESSSIGSQYSKQDNPGYGGPVMNKKDDVAFIEPDIPKDDKVFSDPATYPDIPDPSPDKLFDTDPEFVGLVTKPRIPYPFLNKLIEIDSGVAGSEIIPEYLYTVNQPGRPIPIQTDNIYPGFIDPRCLITQSDIPDAIDPELADSRSESSGIPEPSLEESSNILGFARLVVYPECVGIIPRQDHPFLKQDNNIIPGSISSLIDQPSSRPFVQNRDEIYLNKPDRSLNPGDQQGSYWWY